MATKRTYQPKKLHRSKVHGFQLVEPGVDGGLGELSFQLGENIVPHVGDGIQKETPLSS